VYTVKDSRRLPCYCSCWHFK